VERILIGLASLNWDAMAHENMFEAWGQVSCARSSTQAFETAPALLEGQPNKHLKKACSKPAPRHQSQVYNQSESELPGGRHYPQRLDRGCAESSMHCAEGARTTRTVNLQHAAAMLRVQCLQTTRSLEGANEMVCPMFKANANLQLAMPLMGVASHAKYGSTDAYNL
jgi:hypothetical protein